MKIHHLLPVLLLAVALAACGSGQQEEDSSWLPPHLGSSTLNDAANPNYTFTLWVETSSPPDDTYYQNLADFLTSAPAQNPTFTFNKAIVRVTGVGAASGEPWYDAMNPTGGNVPTVLALLAALQNTDIVLYALPYLSNNPKESWDIYTNLLDDAPSLAVWWTTPCKLSDGTYRNPCYSENVVMGSLKQSVKWIQDINALAAAHGITKQFTGLVFESEGSPYPNDQRTPQAIHTYMAAYGMSGIKVGMTGDPSQGPAYAGYAALDCDGNAQCLDEGYLQLYNLYDSPKADPNTVYIDAEASGAVSTPFPVWPASIYTDAWLADPSTAANAVWTTDTDTWTPGHDMGFQHAHSDSNNIGLLNFDFYNDGKGYTYASGCVSGSTQCAKLYFMFSTECGPNPPPGITCDCIVDCSQSQINAFGTWNSAEGPTEFLQFLDLANADWQLPPDQFAIFQYQLIPPSWVGQ
jgi:hypothetical protein